MPHAEILSQVTDDLKADGITLKIIEVDDYTTANRLLADKQVDANFFQHIPYLNEQMRQYGYKFIVLNKVHIEPLGIYSSKIKSLNDLKEGGIVAVPSDPTNEARALFLLEDQKLLTLKTRDKLVTKLDIAENPKHLKIEEIDAALLPRVLPDVDLAVIPGNYALQGNLDPSQALALESTSSPYVNVVVIRAEDANREDLKKLSQHLRSEKVREYIKTHYKGKIIPAFDGSQQ